MNSNKAIVSKVLVLENAGAHEEILKSLWEESGLVGIRPQHGDAASVMAILKSNVDLGGIMLYERYGDEPGQALPLARQIHAARPELPIFLRREAFASVAGLEERDVAMFRCVYTLSDLQPIRAILDAAIFSRIYPNELVRGINEITRSALSTLFRHCDVEVETPYLVKDRIIYGEVFTLIAIESNWCRGYMMLQTEEEAVMHLLRRDAHDDSESVNFRELNSVLGEATNMVWGAFKNRSVGVASQTNGQSLTQVPIIINHQRRFISFGSEDPQLCLKYTLRERDRPNRAPVSLYQRFVFNLNWSPESFQENPSVEALVDSGELELF